MRPSGRRFNAWQGGAAGRSPTRIGSFDCDPTLHIASVRGDIVERLDCAPGELEGYGWQPFVPPADLGVTRAMAEDLGAGRGGLYDLRAQARCGEPVLHLCIRTFVVRSGLHLPAVHGVLDLRHTESRRTLLPLGF